MDRAGVGRQIGTKETGAPRVVPAEPTSPGGGAYEPLTTATEGDMDIRSITTAGLLAIVPLACGGEASSSDAEFSGTIRDSAGVQIVENTEDGVWSAEGGWSTEEILTIGEAAGDANYQFGQITGVDVMSDGRIAVLDAQAQRVQVYGPDGTWQRTIGGPGNGPGELSAQAVALYVGRGDTIVVADMGNQRINLVPPEGEATSFPMRIEQGIPMNFEMTGDGSLVVQRRALNQGSDGENTDDLILRQAYDCTILDTLLTPERGGTFEMTDGMPSITLFAPEPLWTMLGERIAFATSDDYRISVYGPDGTLERIVSYPLVPRPVTEGNERTIRELVRDAWEEAGMPPQAAEQMMGRLSFAENWPVFTRMRGGPAGTLWVQRIRQLEDMTEEERKSWNPQLDQGAPEWDVFEADGRYGGVVTLPARFTPFALEEDRIYGVFRDDFDIQYVRVYRLDTGTPSGDV